MDRQCRHTSVPHDRCHDLRVVSPLNLGDLTVAVERQPGRVGRIGLRQEVRASALDRAHAEPCQREGLRLPAPERRVDDHVVGEPRHPRFTWQFVDTELFSSAGRISPSTHCTVPSGLIAVMTATSVVSGSAHQIAPATAGATATAAQIQRFTRCSTPQQAAGLRTKLP